ncbi:hypothetical protein [Cryptosporangium aurantiacum]|uniref:Pre-peptidase C-terminal domain-containing protein n=1 Tax=Cryptosporangium aurantiacum TaxID=134849 RepID=A0A1M7PUF7_9ACTN|nr:hypothetical protein [Cryptosporangium aurantiacum]SHN21035.1 hypothetical protein SAMN05443668_103696 [Cryptosporangium aurantiacum]
MTHRRILTALGTASALAGLLLLSGPTAAVPRSPTGPHAAQELGLAQVTKAQAPHRVHGVNPYLGLMSAPQKADWAYWRAKLAADGKRRAAALKETPATDPRALEVQNTEPVFVDEQEPVRTLGGNDRIGAAEELARFGTSGGRAPSARVVGTLAEGPAPIQFDAGPEDNGSIRKATLVTLPGPQTRRTTTAKIGDGPHGSGGDKKGDFDFYRINSAKAGQRLLVDLTTPASADATIPKLDSVVVLWDKTGDAIALNDDDGETLDSMLAVNIPADGEYYVSVGAYDSQMPEDPFNSGSGPGVGSEGAYSITFGLDADDVDFYRLDLRPGDVLGASVSGSAREISVRDPGHHLRITSRQDQSGIYPPTSPLPGGGNAVLAHVVDDGGPHTIAISSGAGRYDLTLQVYRPGPEARGASTVQTIFLDFDGAQVNTRIWGGTGVRTLSPFRAFLGRWGLRSEQEKAAIDAIVRSVRENLEHDFGGRVAIRVLNSRDNRDPWGEPNVSRVVIGGTADESGLSTVGISQSVDPGNFDTEESALILLDELSNPAGARITTNPSLVAYFATESDRVRFVGQAVGNAVSHEAGHFFGSWHTAAYDETADIMDQGGNFVMLWGVGPDGHGGTDDDLDVDFGKDVFNPAEGFVGSQATAANTEWGLSAQR